MKEVERECLDHDTDEIEHCVEAHDDDAIVSDEPNMVPSALPGAPNGWSPPSPPNNWNPTVDSLKREPLFMNLIIQDVGANSLTAQYFNQREDTCFIPCLQVPLLFLLVK